MSEAPDGQVALPACFQGKAQVAVIWHGQGAQFNRFLDKRNGDVVAIGLISQNA